MSRSRSMGNWLAAGSLLLAFASAGAGEDWLQFKYDSRHSGNASGRRVTMPLDLKGAVPLTDAVFTAPVVADGRVYAVDGAGVAFSIDARTLRVLWRFESPGGKVNCNNISSPAIAGSYLHFGTMAGSYFVLNRESGAVVKEIACGEPIFSAPVVSGGRVYFATLGSKIHALEPDGEIRWVWDFVAEVMHFSGDRWSGEDWRRHKRGRVGPRDQFCCAWNLAAYGKTLVVPAGGAVVWLEDVGGSAELRAALSPRTPTLGLSIGETERVYRQWHVLDNTGRVDVLRLRDGKVEQLGHVPGTGTTANGPDHLSFSSVSLRGDHVYRSRPQEGFGLCRHSHGRDEPQPLGAYPSVAPPVLLRDRAVVGGLDGSLYVIPLSGGGEPWSFETAFGKAISAPVAVCDGHIYFGCEDGYLYVLGPGGEAKLPSKDLQLWKVRSPLANERADSQHDRFTSFADWSNTNADQEGVKPPCKIKWIRRYEGTAKHFSTFGGGRMYTHTAEGQIFAVEQETGRLLWRVYYPGVHVSYTSPLYHEGRLLVPQAGFEKCRMRCLDAATGEKIWEAPFAGSPSWNRQLPPIVRGNLAFYMFGTGRYRGSATDVTGERKMVWLFEHQKNASFPKDHKPMLRAYAIDTGEQVWERDFSAFGSGGDEAGLCLMDDTLYYTCFFGHSARIRKGVSGPRGITAAIDPQSGQIVWLTTRYSMNGGCTISGKDGRLYLGGYNPVEGTEHRYVWCLDASDGSLVWRSESLLGAIQVVTVGPRFLFVHGQYKNGYLLDKETGKVVQRLTSSYKCTRFTLSEPFLVGPNLDLIDLSDIGDIRLVSTGPRFDPSECIGAVASNGRIFYTGHGSGLQASQVYGEEASSFVTPWKGSPGSTTTR